MQDVKPKNIQRIVVRGTNWVGDAVMTVPALRALRRLLPAAQITLAVRPSVRAIFEDADFVDNLLLIESGKALFSNVFSQVHNWRNWNFDLALLFNNAFEGALVARLAGVPIRVGYATQNRKLLLSHALPLPAWRESRHESFYYLHIIAQLEALLFGTSQISEQEPVGVLAVDAERQAAAGQFLREQGVKPERPLVALCPGSINSRAKRWPAERYAALAERLKSELEAEVILIGSAAEIDVSEEVGRHMAEAPIITTGKTDLALAAAILNHADLLITNDTGPAHLAAALGRPTLVIFGPTNPLTTRPLAPEAEILRIPPDCAPCMLRDCPIDHRCMTAITVEQVFENAARMLRQGKRSFPEAVGAKENV